MKYPCIGKGKESGSIVLFYGQGFGITLDSKTWASENLSVHNDIDESYFENITSECLANTKIRIESEDHGYFIQDLAFKHGYIWGSGLSVRFDFCAGYIIFNPDPESMVMIHDTHSCPYEQKLITLPLPPEEDDMKSEEWLISGCDCIYEGELYHFLCKSPFANVAVITKASSEDWDVISVSYDDLEKPQTPVEELVKYFNMLPYELNGNFISRLEVIAKAIINDKVKGVKYEP